MKIKVNLSIGFVGAYHEDELEIPDEELEGMTDLQKEDYIYEYYLNPWADNYIDLGYEEIK